MYTDVQIINQGLSKISSSQISRIDPPTSAIERFVANGYVQWKRSELAKRRWVFALVDNYRLTITDIVNDVQRPYRYLLPVDCLRPIRSRTVTWMQRGRYIHSEDDSLVISYIQNVPETEFDPLFVDVLACRVAIEAVEYITQSNSKKAEAKDMYLQAVAEAGRNNAIVTGTEPIAEDDNVFPFLAARY